MVCLQTFRAQLKLISGSIRSDISERAMKLVHLSLLLQGNSFVAAFQVIRLWYRLTTTVSVGAKSLRSVCLRFRAEVARLHRSCIAYSILSPEDIAHSVVQDEIGIILIPTSTCEIELW